MLTIGAIGAQVGLGVMQLSQSKKAGRERKNIARKDRVAARKEKSLSDQELRADRAEGYSQRRQASSAGQYQFLSPFSGRSFFSV